MRVDRVRKRRDLRTACDKGRDRTPSMSVSATTLGRRPASVPQDHTAITVLHGSLHAESTATLASVTVLHELRPTSATHADGMHGITAESSRAASDRLLRSLRAGGWRPTAWARFLVAATRRSRDQAVSRRRALGQATVLHGVFLFGSGGARWRWVASSWILTVLHLGMLEDRSDLGAANALTLARANLPATGTALGRWLPAAALITDFLDGKMARCSSTTTPFGRYADPLADTAFWISYTRDADESRAIRAAVALTWLSPLVGVAATSLIRGQMTEPPRPRWVRPAVALQIVIVLRALIRRPSWSGESLSGTSAWGNERRRP